MMSTVGTNMSELHRVTITATGTQSHISNSENRKALKIENIDPRNSWGRYEASVVSQRSYQSHVPVPFADIFYAFFLFRDFGFNCNMKVKELKDTPVGISEKNTKKHLLLSKGQKV